ncbi:MAG: hypothetical protein ACLFTI_09465 [Anaerolineales bacterium]
MNDATEIIRIADPEIDATSLAARIETNLRARDLTGPESFPAFEIRPLETEPRTALDFDLRQAREAYAQTWVSADAPGSKLPLLGRLKRALHELIVYYVNQLAAQQMRFNAALLRIIRGRRSECHSDQAALRREIAQLRERVERLERQQGEAPDER